MSLSLLLNLIMFGWTALVWQGFGDGMLFPNLMVYIAEISSKEVRGSLSNAVNICQCIGLCLTYTLAILLPWRSTYIHHFTDYYGCQYISSPHDKCFLMSKYLQPFEGCFVKYQFHFTYYNHWHSPFSFWWMVFGLWFGLLQVLCQISIPFYLSKSLTFSFHSHFGIMVVLKNSILQSNGFR